MNGKLGRNLNALSLCLVDNYKLTKTAMCEGNNLRREKLYYIIQMTVKVHSCYIRVCVFMFVCFAFSIQVLGLQPARSTPLARHKTGS